MKKLMVVMAALLPLVLVAQQLSVKWGAELKRNGGSLGYQYVAGATAKNYFVMSQPRKVNALLKYDMKHNLVSEKELAFALGKENLKLLDFVRTKSYSYAYLERDNKKEDKRETYMQQVDENGNFVGGPKLVASVPNKARQITWGAQIYLGLRVDDAGGLRISPNRSLLLTITYNELLATSAKDKFSITVFDENLKTKWQKQQALPYDDNEVELEMIKLANNGTIIIIAKVYTTETDKKQKSLGYKYKAFLITENDFKEVDIDLGEDKLVMDAGLFFEGGNTATVTGLYTIKSNKESKANGIFGLQIDCNTGQVTANHSNPFSEKMLNATSNEKDIKKGRGIYNLKLIDFITLSNGTMVMVAESYREYDIRMGSSQFTDYHSDEKLLFAFNPDISMKYDQIIKNASSSYVRYVASVAVYPVQNNHLLLLYNSGKDAHDNLRATLVDEEGKIESDETIDLETKSRFYFDASETLQIAPDKILVNGKGVRDYKFGTLEVKLPAPK